MNRSTVETTSMFRLYCVRLAIRSALFAACVFAFVTDRSALDPAFNFGLEHGLNLVNVAFVLMIADLLSKFFTHARISMGSLKQYRRYQIPTSSTVGAQARDMLKQLVGGQAVEYARQKADMLRQAIANPTDARSAMWIEFQRVSDEFRSTGEVSIAYVRKLLNNRRFLDFLRFNDEYLEVDAPLKARLRARRFAEIGPVIVFWVVFNAAIALVLALTGTLAHETAFLWAMFYFMFDVFSVVVWCPLQLVFMRNRCCATCQIFNWDGIMAATPLLFVGGWFGWTLLALALVVLLRWEVTAALHPERFDETTNARLSCAQCTEKLCRLRGKITPRETPPAKLQPTTTSSTGTS